MNNEEFHEVTYNVMSDTNYQNVNARTVDLWLLMSACQTMAVSPVLHTALRDMYTDLGKRLQAIVVTIHPDAKELADRGWDTFVDEPLGASVVPHPWWMFFNDDDDEFDDYPDENDIPI